MIARFAERAFRRPVTPEEVDRVVRLFRIADERGESFERAVQVALTTVLASPQFLFMIEPGEGARRPPPDGIRSWPAGSRISSGTRCPTSSSPREARAGTLRANLRGAGRADALASAKSDEFVPATSPASWLQLRKLGGVARDADLYLGSERRACEGAMRPGRRSAYLAYILRENRSILELLDSDYTFAQPRHRKRGITRDSRASRATSSAEGVTHVGDRRRGKGADPGQHPDADVEPQPDLPREAATRWILQQVLGTPPPPPPPEVAKLDESRKAAEVMSLRERMEAHRANPDCASCHNQMDPLGFALENFDAIGRWRAVDGGSRIDASGELARGVKFADAAELKQRLRTSSTKKFARTLIESMLTYGLGRGLEPYDYCTVEEIRGRLVADDYRIRNIVFGIVESRAFQYRGVAR